MTDTSSLQTFENSFNELETLVTRLEAGQLSLEESLAAYKRGTELLQFCQKTLQEAQQQVRILTEANTLQNFSGAADNS